MHQAPGLSKLTKFYMATLKRNDLTQMRFVAHPHMTRHDTPDRTMPQGSKWKTGHLNMHKALRWSQLRKTDTGTLEQNGPTRTHLVGRPHTVQHDAPDRMNMPQGSKQQTDLWCMNIGEATRWFMNAGVLWLVGLADSQLVLK